MTYCRTIISENIFCLPFNILTKNLNNYSSQQYCHTHVELLFKFPDKIANKRSFLKISNLQKGFFSFQAPQEDHSLIFSPLVQVPIVKHTLSQGPLRKDIGVGGWSRKCLFSLTLCSENVLMQVGGWFKKGSKHLYVI